jgi:hypothetical protein
MDGPMNDKDIIKTARTRMSESVNADRQNREDGLNDLEFTAGIQWPETERLARETAARPCLTLNRMPRFVRQVTGDIRKLNPSVKVLPADREADEAGAELFEGLIRQTEYASDASSVYEGSAESAAQCGIGNFRILSEYADDTSFDQEIKIERIHNPFAVYWDPEARQSTRADAQYCFITDRMSQDDFDKKYPGKSATDAEHDGNTDGLECWSESGDVIVAEYYWKEPKKIKLGQLRSGEVIQDPTAAHDVVRKRTVDSHQVKWAKVSGMDVLEGPKDVPSSHIPVIAVTGEEIHVGDRIVRTSVIRFAKDPQQLYNYYASADAEVVALQPKAPYLVTIKQVAGLEAIWDTANDANRAYLPYNPDEKAPPPMRTPPPVASGAMQQGMARAEDDMKATTGIYDAALGGRSNEQSGVAIRQRQLESDISTSIYTDNLAKSIEHAGRVMVDMIPRVYDTDRIIRIMGDDDDQKMVRVNGQEIQMGPDMMPQAVPVNPLSGGKYDVRVSVGPNYTTRRQETAESMMQFVQAFPAAGQVAGDLIAKSMDWPDADKLAERLKKILPPGIISMEEMEPEDQQAMQQQQQQAMASEQEQKQIQQAMVQAEIRSKTAKASEDESDAVKAAAEAQKTQVETAIMSGELNDAIAQIVQQQVMLALQGAVRQGFGPL